MTVTGDNSIFKSSFRRNIVNSFIDGFDFDSTDNYFLFMGLIDGWTAGEAVGNLSDTRSEDIDIWRNIVGMKQIDINSVFRMANRYDWENNTVYTEYNDTVDMKDKKYYVLNSEYNVYKCISNNNNIASSVEPKGIKTNTPITTSEGYVWKYMYTIPEPYRYYIDDEFIPVNKLNTRGVSTETKNQWTTQTNANRGGIEALTLGPTGKWDSDVIFPAGSTGTNLTSNALVGVTSMALGNNITGFSDDDFNGLTITITTGSGAGQKRVITDYVAATNKIHFDLPLTRSVYSGSIIEIAPKIDIYGDGVSAEAFIDLYDYDRDNDSRKQIRNLVITNPGKDYSYANIEVSPLLDMLSGVPPVISAVISPPNGHGADASNELNATSLLLVVNIDQDEDGNFFTTNEIRQYGIVKNPILNDTELQYLDTDGYPFRLAGDNSPLHTYLEVATATEIAFLPETLYTTGNYVIGKDSKATGKIEGWSPSIKKNHGTLTISNLQGNFIAPVDNSVIGEGIAEFSQSGDTWLFSPASGVAAVSAFDKIYRNVNPAFSCTTTLGISGGPGLDSTSFPIDIGVTGGSAGAGCTGCPTGLVLDWTPDNSGTGGTLVLSDVRKTFNIGDSIGSYAYASTTSVINTVTPSEILPFSGDIIYVQNMKPIEKEPEQREQYQIILKF